MDDSEAKAKADEIYSGLLDAGIEVIYDDRDVRPGVMFSDADLLGVPVRVVVSPRNLQESCVEVVARDKSFQDKVGLDEVIEKVIAKVQKLKVIPINK